MSQKCHSRVADHSVVTRIRTSPESAQKGPNKLLVGRTGLFGKGMARHRTGRYVKVPQVPLSGGGPFHRDTNPHESRECQKRPKQALGGTNWLIWKGNGPPRGSTVREGPKSATLGWRTIPSCHESARVPRVPKKAQTSSWWDELAYL